MSMLTRAFSKREKALMVMLAIIILAAFYYFTVHLPCKEAKDAAQSKIDTLTTENTALIAKIEKKNRMVKELEEIYDNPELQEVPKFDNLGAVTAYLNGVLDSSISYDIQCGDVKFDEGARIYRRPVQIRCRVANYANAKGIVEEIKHCPYLSQMSGVTISPAGDTRIVDGVKVRNTVRTGTNTLTLTMNFYEGN